MNTIRNIEFSSLYEIKIDKYNRKHWNIKTSEKVNIKYIYDKNENKENICKFKGGVMYKVITAIGNENINNELRETNKYDVVFSDIIYQEALIEILEKNKVDKIILLDTLPGQMDKYEFINIISNMNDELDIIIINENEDKKFSKYLLSNGITKQINSYEIDIDKLCKIIDKTDVNKYINNKIETKEETEYQNKRFDKKVITINGINSSGKTTFAVNLALTLANQNKKVLLIDLDTINASVDKFLDIQLINKNIVTSLDDDKKCVLNDIVDYIQKGMFDYNVFSKFVIGYSKNKNLSVITGNTSMYVCQNVLCENYYQEILNKAVQVYDHIVIDTNSSLFIDSTKWALEKANIVYYLFEGTYKDVVYIKNTFNIYEKVWNICINKIEYILNKQVKYSLSRDTIENILNIRIKQIINFNDKYIESLNNAIPIIYQSDIEKGIYERIININKTDNIFNKIKNSIKGVL